jgi:streptogrisin C
MDPAGDATANRGGARAQRVDDNSARLDAIVAQLDRLATQNGPGGVQSWHVDVPSNSVVITLTLGKTDGRTAAMLRLAASFGDSVRIETAPADRAPHATDYLVGGFEFQPPTGGPCSVGFNTRDASNRNVVLTAGHCVTSGNMSRNGYLIGAARTTNFPTDDFGTFWNSYASYWQPSPSVYKYNGTYIRLVGQWNNPTVGATVCKSGRTTGYTCGTIKALNESVNYSGKVVDQLVRHTACVEGGDSGGSNISSGAYALGVTSGASTIGGKCLSKSGLENISYYQPVAEALSRNGLRLVL